MFTYIHIRLKYSTVRCIVHACVERGKVWNWLRVCLWFRVGSGLGGSAGCRTCGTSATCALVALGASDTVWSIPLPQSHFTNTSFLFRWQYLNVLDDLNTRACSHIISYLSKHKKTNFEFVDLDIDKEIEGTDPKLKGVYTYFLCKSGRGKLPPPTPTPWGCWARPLFKS